MLPTLRKIDSSGLAETAINEKYHPYECGCVKCISACFVSPCIPTPKETDGILSLNLMDKISVCFYPDLLTQTLRVWIGPKALDLIPGSMIGVLQDVRPCSMLDLNTCKCTIHTSGYKPLEGRLGGCHIMRNESLVMRSMVLDTWSTPDAGNVIDKYFSIRLGDNIHLQEKIDYITFVKEVALGKYSIQDGILKLHTFRNLDSLE